LCGDFEIPQLIIDLGCGYGRPLGAAGASSGVIFPEKGPVRDEIELENTPEH
jgi:hypothetical protein